jgi:hypothetical protein
MPFTKRVRARPEQGGFSARLIYLDSRGEEQVAVFSTTSSPHKILRSGITMKKAFCQAFKSVGCELLSAQVMVEGSAPLDIELDSGAPAVPAHGKPRLSLVPKAAGAAVAMTVAAALLQACITGDS